MAKWALSDYCQWCGAAPDCKHAKSCMKALAAAYPLPNIDKTEGRKDDVGKARYDLMPPEVEEAIAKVLAFGAAKYGERNWERGMNWGRPFAALRRHMAAWWSGEANDPETGMSHLHHACANIAFLIAFEARKIGKDDRPT